ncbi:MAG: hypothetical protein PUI48_02365 [Oscillospiraceae bacterium]|nr:hypothetical protein [Oscillospiraceae bacterium]MDY3792756.1 hypothetical protein [Oscillospiraceae bacterium]MDY6207662.1 hypothetical protein [Oscillospiraceae bacterium]
MNGIYYTRFADVVDEPAMNDSGSLLPIILVIGVITAAVLLIRHFKGKKK